jgi:alpha-galactosidase
MKALADYVHSKGLKFGLYSDAGEFTCQHRPGGLTHETMDADTYAEWGVDYLKYDNCFNDNLPPQPRYTTMSNALLASGRPIYFSLCEWGEADPATWAGAVGNSWRTTGDIQDNWGSMLSNLDANDKWAKYAGPGQWNDPDMLEVGNGGLNFEESKAHFSLWSLVKSPLLIGCDLESATAETLTILKNKEVIAINQDVLGVQGKKITSTNDLEVWAGPLAKGKHAVILFNRSGSSAVITANWTDLGLAAGTKYQVRDLWAHADMGVMTESFSANVTSHGVFMVKLTPVSVTAVTI